MNTPQQEKAAYFAQYWGQQAHRFLESDEVLKVNPEYCSVAWYLELKPLSLITDEDAIEVAKMATHLHDAPSWIAKKIEDGKVWFEYDGISRTSAWSKLFVKVSSFPLQGPFEYREDAIIKEFHYQFPLQAYDFLRSKGYALPFRQYSIEQLIEMDWLKLKTKN